MRSTMSFYWAVAGDGAGGTLAVAWFFTYQEANDWWSSIDQGGSGSVPPTPYWICLNKWNVGVLISAATAVWGTTAPQSGPFVSSKEEADAFGIRNPKTAIDVAWEFDSTDKWWVNNMRIASEKVGL
jgi:hypothetical protein